MKRIFLAAIAAAALLAGCAKSEDAPEARKLNVVFSVADKDSYGADTKAVKQGWSYGDEILIVFESETYEWLNPSGNDNTVLLAYDGEGWYVANQDDDLIKNLRTSSSWFYAVHYPGTIMLGAQDGEGKTKFLTYEGGEYLTADGEWTLDFAIEKIKQNTRIYSRKQVTWYQKDEEITWFHPDDIKGILKHIEEKI